MCGIAGCILKKGVIGSKMYESLKRLEYRGYDSVGIASIYDGKLMIKKDAGKIDEVDKILNLRNIFGRIAISHTRWSTHGAPTRENAHPHTDCRDSIAVVHNGVIENFLELKNELIDKGHKFRSRTDTEVFPHLIEEELKRGLSLYDASLNAVKRLKGSYAFAVISVKEPDKIICIRNESPLVIGVGEDGMYCASDIPAILPYTNKIIPLRNGEIAVLTEDSYEIRRIRDDRIVRREPQVIEWDIEAAAKQGYPHFMLKEIHEQPDSLRDALRLQEKYLDLITLFLDRGRRIFIIGAGTSYHAGLAASYIFSKLGKVHVHPVISSEFIENYGDAVDIDTVVLAVSQSGETYDTLKAVEYARMRAATVIGITNTLGSTLTRVSRAYILQQAGPEIGVAATKTFTSQLTVLSQIALRLSKVRGKLSQDEIDEFTEELSRIPDIVGEVIKRSEDKVRALARKYRDKNLFIFLGRGVNTATAYEGRLKLLEIAYIPSLAFPAGESVSYDTPVMIKDKDGIRVRRISEVIDKYFEDDEEGVKEVEGLYTLGIDSRYNVKFRRVKAVARHKANKIYRIRYQGGEIRTTGDHSVYVFGNEGIESREVRNLKTGDVLVTFHKSHIDTEKDSLVIDVKEYYYDEYARNILELYEKAFELYRRNLSIPEISKILNLNEDRVRGWIRRGRVPLVIRNLGEPYKIKITPELMKLFGYYLAKGCVWSIKRKKRRREEYSISFRFHGEEGDEIKFVIGNMKRYFNVEPSRITHPGESKTSIIYNRKRVALLFKNLFGSNEYDKKIPPFFYSLSHEYVKSFLEGYSADGYISRDGKLSLFTVNKDLAVSILWLLRIHGINSILVRRNTGKRRINGEPIKSKRKYIYMIELPESENILLKKRVDKTDNLSKSSMIPSESIKEALKPASKESYIPVNTSSKYGYILKKNYLVNINNAGGSTNLLLKYDGKQGLKDIQEMIFSDLGGAKVLDIDIEDYNGYVYDFCGAENEAFFGGFHPILLHNSKHGPISLIEEGVPVIFIAPRDRTRKDVIGNIMEMKARGARIISLCEEGDKEIIELSDEVIEMPRGIPELLTPIPYVVPLQLFAYYMAIERGLDPDKPRNLAKSVTVP